MKTQQRPRGRGRWSRGHVCAQAPGTAGAVPLVTKDPPLWQRSSSRLTSQEDLAIKIRSFAQEETITWGFSKVSGTATS